MIRELKYTVKAFRSILSGPLGWVVATEDEWRPAELMDWSFSSWYICAEYQNGRHIPFPVLDGVSGSWFQRRAIRAAEWLSGNSAFPSDPPDTSNSGMCVVSPGALGLESSILAGLVRDTIAEDCHQRDAGVRRYRHPNMQSLHENTKLGTEVKESLYRHMYGGK